MLPKRKRTLLLVLSIIMLVAAPLWAQFGEPVLAVGDWVLAEPWHNLIGGAGRVSRVRLHVLDSAQTIQRVDFYHSIDQGQTWILFGTDSDGYEALSSPMASASTDLSAVSAGDGWATVFPHDIVPSQNMVILFQAVAIIQGGDTLIIETQRNYDPTPPCDAVVSWTPIHNDTLWVMVTDLYHDIDSVSIFVEPKQDTFMKGIPGISQQPHSPWHCVPTAAAACLKYFEGTGDGEVAGGLSAHDLVDSLAELAGTDTLLGGTQWDDIVEALDKWLKDHGDNYTMRDEPFNWEDARNELERCQDVLVRLQWPGSDNWHMMTFNSIVNTPNFDGTIRVDFMDPWTGEIEWGDLDPITGRLSGFSGAGPTGTLTDMLIICPKEDTPHVGPDTAVGGGPGPDPQPMPIPLPDTCNWFLHVVVVDQQGNACRFINIVPGLSVVPGPNQQGMIIPNFYLAQNDPNPFSSKTDIAFSIPTKSVVDVSVYNTVGQKVITLIHGTLEPGTHSVTWNGRDEQGRKLGNGIYICELTTADGFKQTTKMLLVK
ncbi:MAG: T9SS type A sorting domain-containing protein [Candidatus Stahlbacteria bacterium]|nr:MAG: T9SS type A sorting domain-containing protein [Candidatus Stahlbacteria bacterium]